MKWNCWFLVTIGESCVDEFAISENGVSALEAFMISLIITSDLDKFDAILMHTVSIILTVWIIFFLPFLERCEEPLHLEHRSLNRGKSLN